MQPMTHRAEPAPTCAHHAGTEAVATEFREFFEARGYDEVPSVSVASKVDPTVRLVGSSTSIFKQRISTCDLAHPGSFVVQTAVRTHNLERLIAREPIRMCTQFIALGTMQPADSLEVAARDGIDFLLSMADVTPDRLVLQASSTDNDLIAALERHNRGVHMAIDQRPGHTYRHGFGELDLSGRNANFGWRCTQTGQIRDVGNLIVIERQGVPAAVEICFGAEMVAMCRHALDHPLKVAPVSALIDCSDQDHLRLADALTASVVMLHAGVRPNASSRGRVARSYLAVVAESMATTGTSPSTIEAATSVIERQICGPWVSYEQGELGPRICSYLDALECADRLEHHERGRLNEQLRNFL